MSTRWNEIFGIIGIFISLTSFAGWQEDGNLICNAANFQQEPAMVSDGSGGAIIVWEDWRNDPDNVVEDIYAQRVDASGNVQWTPNGVVICDAENSQFSFVIVSDGSGGAIIAWRDWRDELGEADIYAQRVDASGNVQWTEDGVVICDVEGMQTSLASISDGSGGAIIVWMDGRSGNFDIYAQRVDASGNVQWTEDGVVICDAEGALYAPGIISDGAGGAIIAWRERKGSSEYDIYAQRVDASGNVQWTEDGIVICDAEGVQWEPKLTSDGEGGAIIAWSDDRNEDWKEIYAQRVDASGNVQWTEDGVVICDADNEKWEIQITSDGEEGAIIAWRDRRDDEGDIYAQRVDASGNVQWTEDGVVICDAEGEQFAPGIVSDGSGGAIIAWNDERGSSRDIYAQRVDASGNVQWTEDGVVICDAEGGQTVTSGSSGIVSDGEGGAIVTWDDNSSATTSYDIYAGHVNNDGVVGVELVKFSALPHKEGVELLWSTEIESEVYKWLIVRTCGEDQKFSNWRQIAELPAKGSFSDYQYIDSLVSPGTIYYYKLGNMNKNGIIKWYDSVKVSTRGRDFFYLSIPYPHPCKSEVKIKYGISSFSPVSIKIYNKVGQPIKVLVNKPQKPGSYTIIWDGKDENNYPVASGIYFCQFKAHKLLNHKIIYIK